MGDAKDIVLHQRVASGYVPGKSETFGVFPASPFTANPPSGATPTSCKLQNCQIFRPVGSAVGVYDILVGLPQSTPVNQTALRAAEMPFDVGLGGAMYFDPPLNVPGGGIVVNQGRATLNVRSTLANPPSSVDPGVEWAVQYGASLVLGGAPIYPGFSNNQIVRFIVTAGGDPIDIDFDFSIERVLDPSVES
jgi:hypothetical protein